MGACLRRCVSWPSLSGVGRLISKDAILLGAAVTTRADSAKAYVKRRARIPFHPFRQGYIKFSVRLDMVEHIAPMMPAPFAVGAVNDLIRGLRPLHQQLILERNGGG